MNPTHRTKPWLNTEKYPFQIKYMQLRTGNMHYIDEGEGEVLLFIHGTPTWSFLYRNFIQAFSHKFRCIAIDHLGFGLSDKPIDFDGSPQSHAVNLTEFIHRLNLKNITLIVHDFGGPIGLAYAIQHPDNIQRIIMSNTWLWETKSNPAAQKVDQIIRSTLGRFLYLRLNFSPRFLLKQGFADKNKLTKDIHRHYMAPFPNKNSRLGLLSLAQSLIGSSDWYADQWQQLDTISKKPWLIVWGVKDRFITPSFLEKWKNRLTHADIVELDCGHFVQEESAKEVAEAMERFLEYDRGLSMNDVQK